MATRSDLLDRELRRAVRRVAQRAGTDADRGWPRLAELGALAAGLPADSGGLCLGLGTAVGICEELGHELADPLLLDTMTAADLLAGAEPHRPMLDALLAGRLRIALAVDADPAVESTEDGWRVDGVIPFVTGADRADAYLLAARTGGGRRLHVVPAARPGSRSEPHAAMPTVALCALHLDGLRLYPPDALDPADLDASGPDPGGPELAGSDVDRPDAAPGSALPTRVRVRARIRRAAYLVGLASAAHALTVRHARQRRQFDRLLADNQAVAFPLAELAVRLEATRRCVRHCGRLQDAGEPCELPAVHAAATAAELALDATRIGVHLHGAFGMTDLASISRHYRHAAVEALRDGGPARLYREAGRLRLSTAGRGDTL